MAPDLISQVDRQPYFRFYYNQIVLGQVQRVVCDVHIDQGEVIISVDTQPRCVSIPVDQTTVLVAALSRALRHFHNKVQGDANK